MFTLTTGRDETDISRAADELESAVNRAGCSGLMGKPETQLQVCGTRILNWQCLLWVESGHCTLPPATNDSSSRYDSITSHLVEPWCWRDVARSPLTERRDACTHH